MTGRRTPITQMIQDMEAGDTRAADRLLEAVYDELRALAQHMTGDTIQAIETEKRALSLIPQNANDTTRTEMQNNLNTFEAALSVAHDGN